MRFVILKIISFEQNNTTIMKIHLKKIILLSAACLVLFACKKEDDEPAPTKKSNSELIIGTWVATNYEAPPPLDTVDIWTGIPSCIKDNEFTFSSGGNGVIDEGGSKCEPADPQSENFSWEWTNTAETEMTWMDNDDTLIIKEVNVTSTTFVGNQILVGAPYEYIKITMARQ